MYRLGRHITVLGLTVEHVDDVDAWKGVQAESFDLSDSGGSSNRYVIDSYLSTEKSN